MGRAPEAGAEQVREAARAAKEAQRGWAATSPEERGAVLDRAASLMAEQAEHLVALGQAETGAPPGVVKALHLGVTAARFRRYAKGATEPTELPIAPQVTAPTALAAGGLVNAIAMRQPVGRVRLHHPVQLPPDQRGRQDRARPGHGQHGASSSRPPRTPSGIIEMVKVFDGGGLPARASSTWSPGPSPRSGRRLVDSPDVDMISFTGSSVVGAKIFEAGGKTMKRLLMELGGKGAALVLDDADIADGRPGDRAASGPSTRARSAPPRPGSWSTARIYQQLVDGLARLAKVLQTGDPLDPATVVGPVISGVAAGPHRDLCRPGRTTGPRWWSDGRTARHLEKRLLRRPDAAGRVQQRHDVVRRRDLRPGRRGRPLRRRGRGHRHRQRLAPTACTDYVFSKDTARAYRVAQRLRCGQRRGQHRPAATPTPPSAGSR